MTTPASGPQHEVRELLRDCVHCGFCLSSCPTYLLWGEEMDSPRGRIHLIGQLADGAALTPSMALHFDRCLSCMACVSACPSGVRYDLLIEQTRAEVEQSGPRRLSERLLRAAVFALFPYPRRLGWARNVLAAAERLGIRSFIESRAARWFVPDVLRTMTALAPPAAPRAPLRGHLPAAGSPRGRIGLLSGCVQQVFFSELNAATARVLAAEGFEVVVPQAQGCCGALSWHAGRTEEAERFARATIDGFERHRIDTVVVSAAGCGSAVKDYGQLLLGDPAYAERARAFSTRSRDVAELLAEVGQTATYQPLHEVVAYQDACHLAHAQRLRAEPRAVLGAIPELEVREIDEPELCCGSAGVYNLLQPEAGRSLGDRKAANVLATGAEVLVSANPGCLMQLRAALARASRPMPVLHLVQVLDASIRGVALAEVTRRAAGAG